MGVRIDRVRFIEFEKSCRRMIFILRQLLIDDAMAWFMMRSSNKLNFVKRRIPARKPYAERSFSARLLAAPQFLAMESTV